MKNYNFAIFIFCWGRPQFDNTIRSLRRCGYTGRIICLLDDLDETRENYIAKYGKENCWVFDKKEIAKKVDTMDNFGKLASTVYVENAMWDAAKFFGLEYFAAMCDDYESYSYKREKERVCKDLDNVFDAFVDFLKDAKRVDMVCMGQGGDYINPTKPNYKRKAMNCFVCCTERQSEFYGTMNDDCNMYLRNGAKGKIYLTYNRFILHQPPTQQVKGGLSEVYKENGTYTKSMYSVMVFPSAVKVQAMGTRYLRLHHEIEQNSVYPCIIREEWKKKSF